MAKDHVVTLLLACRGAGESYEEAEGRAIQRLKEGAARVATGERPRNPGTQFEEVDPGGGPCAPIKRVDVLISADGLPEAQSNDDD